MNKGLCKYKNKQENYLYVEVRYMSPKNTIIHIFKDIFCNITEALSYESTLRKTLLYNSEGQYIRIKKKEINSKEAKQITKQINK